MKYSDFRNKTISRLTHYKKDILGITECGKWRNISCDHILPKNLKKKNYLPGVTTKGIPEHTGICHLNSSQMMCINFFQPLLQSEDGKQLMCDILKDSTGIDIAPNGIEAIFEYTTNINKEHTNFDLYISSGNTKLYFEIKYTEYGFGRTSSKTDPQKYKALWKNVYHPRCQNSLYLKDLTEDRFYANYQINRIVSYITQPDEHAVFIFPFGNVSLTREFDSYFAAKNSNVHALCWRKLAQTALTLSGNTAFNEHFVSFCEKYIWDWDE